MGHRCFSQTEFRSRRCLAFRSHGGYHLVPPAARLHGVGPTFAQKSGLLRFSPNWDEDMNYMNSVVLEWLIVDFLDIEFRSDIYIYVCI